VFIQIESFEILFNLLFYNMVLAELSVNTPNSPRVGGGKKNKKKNRKKMKTALKAGTEKKNMNLPPVPPSEEVVKAAVMAEKVSSPPKEPIFPFPPTPPPGKAQDLVVVAEEESNEASEEAEFVVVQSPEKMVMAQEHTAARPNSLYSSSPVNPRTPMTHIRLGGDLRMSEEEKVEISTPNERQMRQIVNKLAGITATSCPSSTGAASGDSNKSKFEMFSEWNNELVTMNEVEKIEAYQWNCITCTFVNDKQHALVCEMCGVAKDNANVNNNKKILEKKKSWGCKACSFENDDCDSMRCEVCETRREKEDGFAMMLEEEEKVEGHENEKERDSSKFLGKVRKFFQKFWAN